MIFSRKLLQFLEFTSAKDEGVIVIEASDTSQIMEEECQRCVEELSVWHVDTDEYTKGVENLEKLSEAIERHDKVAIEKLKIELQIAEANNKRMVDWGAMTPKLVAIVAYAGITCVLIALERQTPLSMRWLRALDALLAPRGI